ncbi:hypothetical protein B0H13DRAFT_1878903 [Mycena leptocephala]|nr:hypothetical protein B0H13DRAFT_1878903 [Mycena leptocephala]
MSGTVARQWQSNDANAVVLENFKQTASFTTTRILDKYLYGVNSNKIWKVPGNFPNLMVKNSLVAGFHVLQLLHLLVAGLAESIRQSTNILIGRTMVYKMIDPSRGPEMCRVDCASFHDVGGVYIFRKLPTRTVVPVGRLSSSQVVASRHPDAL